MIPDNTLLRRYARERSEEAFAQLVHRHLPLVYSAALRRLGGDAHRAEDVAQTVFCNLARDARRLRSHAVLAGWFYTATRNTAIDVVRAEQRRRAREEEAYTMQTLASGNETPTDWSRLRPVLDTAMDELSDDDREAVLLRFFQRRPFADIGSALGLSEDAARKRVDRALEKLRAELGRRGIGSTSAALATLLASEAAAAVPAAVMASVTSAGVVAGGTAAAGVATVVALTKLQAGVAAAVTMVAAVGLAIQQHTLTRVREEAVRTDKQRVKLAVENAVLATAREESAAALARLRIEVAAAEHATAEGNRTDEMNSASALNGASRAVAPPPRVDAAAREEEKAKLHRRYDPFLQRYGLTLAQMDRFVELKIAILEAQEDLQAGVRQASLQGGADGVEKLRAKLTGPMWGEIRQLLGEEGYRAYPSYEISSGYRICYVDPLLAEFAAANAPLSSPQADQLVEIFASNRRSLRANPSDISTRSTMNWDAVVIQANPILTPAQRAVLRETVSRQHPAR
jgi:RNA polymerase sigma factor (sigma-70 family)